LRKIVHIDMDAFYASVEQRDDPALRGRPVVVAWRGARSVVCAASYEARRFGIRSAMPAMRAEKLCPQAVFVPPDFPRYKAVSAQIRTIFAGHTEMIEPLSLDEAYLDVSVPKSDLPSATAIAAAIRTEIRDTTALTASAGIAGNKFLAKIASDWRKPDGQFVIRPERALEFLTPLPVGKLPGVGRVMEARLAELGIATVGELRARAQGELQARFGRWGARLAELALGIDDSPVSSAREVQSVSSEDTFAADLALDELAEAIIALAERTWRAQSRLDRVGRSVVLKLKTSDFRLLTRSYTPPAPPASQAEFTELALGLRARVDLPDRTRYRLVGVGLGNFCDRDELAAQRGLWT
jgi:DNA polymerase IV